MQESNCHGDGRGRAHKGCATVLHRSLIPRSGIGDCEAQEQPQRTWAEERQQLVSWVATAGAIWRWKGKWKRKTGIGTVDSLSLGWHVTLVEAWVGIVDFAHKSYQSESGYEALEDEAFRLGLFSELCAGVAFVDAMTLCCLVQPSGIVRRWRIHMTEQRCEVKMKAISLCCLVQRSEIVRRWRKRARRKRKQQAVLRAKQASLAKVEQEQGQGGQLAERSSGGVRARRESIPRRLSLGGGLAERFGLGFTPLRGSPPRQLFPMDSEEARTTEGRQRKGWRQAATRSRSQSQSRGVQVGVQFKRRMDILIWCTLVYHMEIMEIKDGSSGRSQGWSKKKTVRTPLQEGDADGRKHRATGRAQKVSPGVRKSWKLF
jgi:hypothetical protein